MTKLCSVCGTENREEAQFCRACGTAFSAQLPRAAGDGNAQNVCPECGFQNKPGLRYCANCGMSLGEGAAGEAGAGGSPPPLNYPSFAPVAPYPPAPFEEAVPDIPDPDAEIALRQQEAAEGAGAAMPFESAPSRGRSPIVIGAVALALVVAGALAWTYMRRSDSAPPAIGATTPPVAPTEPASAAAPPPSVVEQAPAAAAPAVAATASAVEAPPPAAAEALPPAAARPLPQVGDAKPPESAEAEAQRVAAERRAKAARDKADRDAKAAVDQQNAAAAQRAEQDAARKRADDAPRPRAAAPTPTTAAAAQVRGVREICAGRGTIAEAVCQSRTCGQPEHANEAICRQLREQDDRRRNYGN